MKNNNRLKSFWQEYKDAVHAVKEERKASQKPTVPSPVTNKKKTPRATAASLVMNVLKKKGAFTPETAIEISAFKDLPLATSTISYTIANLMEQKVIVQTPDQKYYYSEKGYKHLENTFLMGYSAIFIVPIVVAILVWLLRGFF